MTDAVATRAGRARLLDVCEAALARWLAGLPGSVQVRLAGGAPVVVDGEVLAPDVQLLLALRARLGMSGYHTLPVEEARRRMRRETRVHAGPVVPVASVSELLVDGGEGPLRARHYRPPVAGPVPLLVFFHGGGFVIGDLDTHDLACRLLCREAGVQVLSVDYRLAPEHPFPAAVEDARAAFRWARVHAADLGADPASVAVGGDSAGGTLSTVVAHLAVREREPAPTLQLLVYPAVDRSTSRPSLDLFARGFLLTRAEIEWFHAHYAGHAGADRSDPRLSPLRAPDLSGLPPAIVVTVAFDPLRDEGEAYAAALSAAGTRTTLRRLRGVVHGFVNMAGVSPTSRDALLEVARLLRAVLHAQRCA